MADALVTFGSHRNNKINGLFMTNKNKHIMSDNKITHSNVFDFTRSIEYSSDGIVSKQIIKNPGGNITLFAFDEGQELSEHSAPFDALVQVLEGEAEIMIDGTLYRVGSGSSVILPANHPHAVKAPGSFKMLLTMVRG